MRGFRGGDANLLRAQCEHAFGPAFHLGGPRRDDLPQAHYVKPKPVMGRFSDRGVEHRAVPNEVGDEPIAWKAIHP